MKHLKKLSLILAALMILPIFAFVGIVSAQETQPGTTPPAGGTTPPAGGTTTPAAGGSTSASKTAICEGLGLTGSSCTPAAGEPTVDGTIKTAVNIISIVVSVAAVVMIMVGGFKYITSSGDANNISSAKNTILYAIIGLVVVALAQVIVRFVVSKV